MLDSGHLTGYAVNSDFENKIVEALRRLAKPEVFAKKYGIDSKSPVLLFAMVMAIIHLQLRRPFGKRSSRRLASIIPRAMRWSRSKMSMMKAWSLNPFIACCSD